MQLVDDLVILLHTVKLELAGFTHGETAQNVLFRHLLHAGMRLALVVTVFGRPTRLEDHLELLLSLALRDLQLPQVLVLVLLDLLQTHGPSVCPDLIQLFLPVALGRLQYLLFELFLL